MNGALASEVLRYSVLDAAGNRARICDLAIDLANGDYPPVTKILYQSRGNPVRAIPFAEAQWNWQDHRVTISSLDEGAALSEEDIDALVLLKRDVLDALVLDLQERHATRANDLWLRDEASCLVVAGADTGGWGLIRRIAHGHVRDGAEPHLLDWKRVEFLRGDPEAARRGRDYHRRVERLPPAHIARLADEIPYLHAAELLTLISDPRAADALEVMSPARQLQVFEELDEDQGVRLLALMAPDAAADLIGRLKPATAERCLGLLPPCQAERVVELLRYPEDSVGGLMTNDIVSVAATLTVLEARELLRDRLKEPDFVAYIYVVEDDASQKLCGLVTLRDFVIARDEQRLEEIMNPWVATLDPLAPATVAARRLVDSHISALPVVGNDRRLLGAVTIDAAVTQVAPADWRSQAPQVFS